MPYSDFFEIVVDELLDGETDITEAAVRTKGTNANRFASAIAAAAEQVQFELTQGVAGLYLDTARGPTLRRLVASDFGVEAHGETAARATVTLSRTATAATTIDALTTFVTPSGLRFTLDVPVVWALDDVSDKPGLVTCTTTGTAGNVDAGTITQIESSLDDATITVTNPQPASGGAPAESDEALIERARSYVARQRRGTLEAIRLGALDVAEARTVDVHESLDAEGLQTGGVYVIAGDDLGRANDLLLAAITDELEEWRPAGIYVSALGSTLVEESIALVVSWAPGQATAANVASLKRAIVARVNNLIPRSAPDGQTADIACQLRHAIIHEAAKTVPGCKGVTVTLPVGTVEPDFGEVIRTRFDLITVT